MDDQAMNAEDFMLWEAELQEARRELPLYDWEERGDFEEVR
jgi:hypothetical protein